MDPSVIDQGSSERPASVTVFSKLFTWMMENKGEGLKKPENQVLFLRKMIAIVDVYAPIYRWKMGRLGDHVKDRSDHRVEETERVSKLRETGIREDFDEMVWDMRVAPFSLVLPKVAREIGIYFHWDYAEATYGGKYARRRLQKQLFLTKDARIYAVELLQNFVEGNASPVHRVYTGHPDDTYLAEIFEKDNTYFDLVLDAFGRIIQENVEQARTRLLEREKAENVFTQSLAFFRAAVGN